MQLHEKIRLFRDIKGWTQDEMAQKLGMSVHGYSDIERGKTDMQVSRLEQIADVLGIKIPDLFGMNDKAVFNLASSWHDNSSQRSYIQSVNKDCEHELEKASLLVEQKDKEIAYLKEIIELMKTAQNKAE